MQDSPSVKGEVHDEGYGIGIKVTQNYRIGGIKRNIATLHLSKNNGSQFLNLACHIKNMRTIVIKWASYLQKLKKQNSLH